MAAIVELPIVLKPEAVADATKDTPARQEPQVRFPDRCIYCGAPAEGTSLARVTYRPARGEREVTSFLQAPYCARHQVANQRITTLNRRAAGLAVTAALAAAIYVAGFVNVIYFVKPLLILAAMVPLSTVFLLFWGILRSLLGRFSSEIRHTGIWRATLGFRADYDKENHRLRFRFLNVEYAAQFADFNKPAQGSTRRPTSS